MNYVDDMDIMNYDNDIELEKWLDRIDQYEIENRDFFDTIDRRNNFDAHSYYESASYRV